MVVDNHDSYTHNLVDLLAVVTGTAPVVVSDDDAAPGTLDLTGFAGIVISPGPGHPARARDFGLAADVLRRSEVPVLGVCLGMQGIGLAAGAAVVPAPQPRHGHVESVRHTGTSVLAGLPQEFPATRYHSFCVAEPLPPELEPLAWGRDGVLMALRHRTRPLVGVQFHPESIASGSGRRIVENFVAMCRPVQRRFTATVRRLDVEVDAEEFFARRCADAPWSFWLDSSARGAGSGRFSFLGDARGPLAEVVTHRTGEPPALPHLAAELARREVVLAGEQVPPFAFTGGYVGWAGYELRDECGAPTPRRADTPDSAWVFADRFVAVDHDRRETWLLALSEDAATAAAAEAWLAETAALVARLPRGPAAPREVLVLPGPDEVAGLLVRAPADYRRDVEACRAALVAGESYEICLTNEARVPVDAPGAALDGFATYRALRRANPAPYAAFLRFGDVEVACSSPERFLHVGVDGTVETRPIKGTVRRDPDPATDEELRGGLQRDAKTRAENLMVVDLLRNDLSRVCVPGSVSVPALMATETLPSVHQLVSTVTGRLRPDVGAVAALRACFPPGSMTGAPKLRTTEVIDALEQRPRGIYSGALGFLACNGSADLAVVIRTMVRVGGAGVGPWRIGAGGAVVLDSDPDAEVAEVLLKAATPLAALSPRTTPAPTG
nr:chorismate-binding protein [Kineococcus siccus]